MPAPQESKVMTATIDKPRLQALYEEDVLSGTAESFLEDGKVFSKKHYKKGKLVLVENFGAKI